MKIMIKIMPANIREARDMGLISGSGGGNSNPFQYSFQENPMSKGAWRATVHGVAKSQAQLSTHSQIIRHEKYP